MTQTHKYRRLFASDLLKIDKNTKNIDFDNNRANKLNQIDNIVEDIPIETQQKKPRNKKPIEESKIEESQSEPELRRSTRERKKKQDEDFIY